MILSYKYRLLPTKQQHAALARLLEDQRQLYNAALEERIGAYRCTGRGRSYMDQCLALTEWRHSDQVAGGVPPNLQRWTLQRLDHAYRGFFRRIKARDGNAGFPRFRGRGWWSSFGFAEFSGIQWDGKRLRWRGMPGALRVHLHRPLPSNIRSCVFKRDPKGWSVCFKVAVDQTESCQIGTKIGIDLGLNVFAYCSDGVAIQSPRIAQRAERQMRQRSRALARCRRGSKRRRKVRVRLTRVYAKITDTRSTWLHQQSAALVNRADLIAAEDLNIRNMMKHPTLARSIADASWSKFLAMVAYKAERAGKHFITVNPRNTSQRCSGCGELVPKSLAVRTHSCPSCGLVIDRDWNASLNILQAVAGLGAGNVAHQGERRLGNLKLVTA